MPEGIHQRVNQRVGQSQEPQIILQHVGEFTAFTQELHYARHKEGAPESQEATHKHCHCPQGLDVTPVAPQLLMLMILLVLLMAMVVSRPGTGLPHLADLLLVAAGDLQDVQVDVNKHREHWEEACTE